MQNYNALYRYNILMEVNVSFKRSVKQKHLYPLFWVIIVEQFCGTEYIKKWLLCIAVKHMHWHIFLKNKQLIFYFEIGLTTYISAMLLWKYSVNRQEILKTIWNRMWCFFVNWFKIPIIKTFSYNRSYSWISSSSVLSSL